MGAGEDTMKHATAVLFCFIFPPSHLYHLRANRPFVSLTRDQMAGSSPRPSPLQVRAKCLVCSSGEQEFSSFVPPPTRIDSSSIHTLLGTIC